MKKLLVLLLATAMTFACVACGNAENGENKGTSENETVKVEIADANEILTKTWDEYKASASQDIQVPIGGGYGESMVMDAPAKFDVTAEGAKDMLIYSFCIPAEAIDMTDDVAAMMNMMMANNFTAASYHITDAANAEKAVSSLKETTINNQWMCGMPEKLIIVTVGEDYVVSAFGNGQVIDAFKTALTTVYGDVAVVAVEENLAQ